MSDYMFILESHLDGAQSRIINEMQRVATEAGQNVWLTGGAMRDVLRGARILDLDFTVERDAVKLARTLATAANGTVVSEDSLKRGAELEFTSGVKASVYNARTEKFSKPGGKPQISPAGIHEDLMRRDFTINAMGLCLNRGSRGLLIDPTNGQADLLNRELRTTNSYALYDDPARLFRLVRFQYSLGFEVAERTKNQLENALLEGYQKSAPVSALVCELKSLAQSENAVAGLEAFQKLGLLQLVPGLTGEKLNIAGLNKLTKSSHSVIPQGTAGGWVAFLAVMMEKMTAKERADVFKALELPKEELELLNQLEARTKKLEAALKSPKITRPSHVYDALVEAPVDEIMMVLYSSGQRVVQDRIRAFYAKYLPLAQEVTEEQVIATGAKPGTPKFEKAMKAMITSHINARPKKVVVPEPEPTPAPAAARGARK